MRTSNPLQSVFLNCHTFCDYYTGILGLPGPIRKDKKFDLIMFGFADRGFRKTAARNNATVRNRWHIFQLATQLFDVSYIKGSPMMLNFNAIKRRDDPNRICRSYRDI